MENGNRKLDLLLATFGGALIGAVFVGTVLLGFLVLSPQTSIVIQMGSIASIITAVAGCVAVFVAIFSGVWVMKQWDQMKRQTLLASLQLNAEQTKQLDVELEDLNRRIENLSSIRKLHFEFSKLCNYDEVPFTEDRHKFERNYFLSIKSLDFSSGPSARYFLTNEFIRKYSKELGIIKYYIGKYKNIFGADAKSVLDNVKETRKLNSRLFVQRAYNEMQFCRYFTYKREREGTKATKTQKLIEVFDSISTIVDVFNERLREVNAEARRLDKEKISLQVQIAPLIHHSPLNKSLKSLPEDELTDATGKP